MVNPATMSLFSSKADTWLFLCMRSDILPSKITENAKSPKFQYYYGNKLGSLKTTVIADLDLKEKCYRIFACTKMIKNTGKCHKPSLCK